MAYTPELSQIGSATLRRLAWYFKKPMTKSLEMLITQTALQMVKTRPGQVCSECRDKTICEVCPFNPHPTK
jgi:recombinational DNA repair protein RecR